MKPAPPHLVESDTALERAGGRRRRGDAGGARHARRPATVALTGVWEEGGELWSPGGEPIAQSRQLALVRERPP